MTAQHFWDTFSSAGRIETKEPRPQFSEADIPAEWRNNLWENYGEVAEEFTPEESAAVELDRR